MNQRGAARTSGVLELCRQVDAAARAGVGDIGSD